MPRAVAALVRTAWFVRAMGRTDTPRGGGNSRIEAASSRPRKRTAGPPVPIEFCDCTPLLQASRFVVTIFQEQHLLRFGRSTLERTRLLLPSAAHADSSSTPAPTLARRMNFHEEAARAPLHLLCQQRGRRVEAARPLLGRCALGSMNRLATTRARARPSAATPSARGPRSHSLQPLTHSVGESWPLRRIIDHNTERPTTQ